MGNQNRDSVNDPKMISFMHRFMAPLKAPSDVPAGLGFSPFGNQLIEPLSIIQIKEIIDQFIEAAERVKKTGADGVELHAGHGYLLNQFLSPYTNLRKDQYGGSIANRTRIIAEIIKGIKEKCGKDFPISVRLTVNEFYDLIGYPDMGITMPIGIQLAQQIEKAGADALNITIANSDTQVLISEPISFTPGWRQPIVEKIRKVVKIPIIAVGVIRTPQQAEQILSNQTQDFIGLGRPLLADSLWMLKAKNNQEQSITRCISCLTCQESYEKGMSTGKHATCALNPRMGDEDEVARVGAKNGKRRKVVIVGAGPAGLVAGRELARRDFKVIIYEGQRTAGGQVTIAAAPPHKDKILWSIIDLEKQAIDAGAEIIFQTAVDVSTLKAEKPYAIFIATGGQALKPQILGSDLPHVVTSTDILKKEITVSKKRVIVIGSGMTGLETAEMLMDLGNEVTIIEMAPTICPNGFAANVWDVKNRLEKGNVFFKTGRRVIAISKPTVTTVLKNGVREEFTADLVVMALGVKRNTNLIEQLADQQLNVQVIGDASAIGRIGNAVRSGFEAARELQ